jgi:hypothetical protein
MKINVTAENLFDGTALDARQGPIALAIAEALGIPESHRVSVVPGGHIRIYAPIRSQGHSYHLVPSLNQFIEDYDAGVTVEPFSFELFLHSEHMRSIAGGKHLNAEEQAWLDKMLPHESLVTT